MPKETTEPTPEAPLGYNAFGEPRFYAKLTEQEFQEQAAQALSFLQPPLNQPAQTQPRKRAKRPPKAK